ncbi:uncharacterized protein LOC129580375 [Sitodiplosis mosellana]|uniref:uncharacterized protein LOC129580375 n=1 Tax=Sitodiplosis mosellana TaxID=263140 RepID=UPI002443C6C4|nr:uncharacterized protein LOC129580375 [Sitodiplosis mosellana]
MKQSLCTVVITILLIVCQHINNSIASKNDNEEHERNKRFVFLQTSGIGYLVALAIPTSAVNRQRVYMAFNFEAHYGLASAETFLSKFKAPFIGDNEVKRDVHGTIVDNRLRHFSDKKNVYTRKNFYRIIEQQITSYGYNGTSCLLRTICETSETPFYENNGVFGNIFHILFTPSSSKAENIESIYYEAEYHGQLQECQRYVEECKISFLDLVSHMVSIESRKMM